MIAKGGSRANRVRTSMGVILAHAATFTTLGAIGAVALWNAPRETLSYYDEGVYYYQGVLLARGGIPYADYFVPQPPGILLIGAASHGCGAGLAGVRVFTWLCGCIVLYQTFWIAKHSAERCGFHRAGLAGLTAAALVVGSNRFVYIWTQGATDLPSVCLVLAAFQLLMRKNARAAWVSGLLLGCSTLFRLQPASLAPAFVAMILIGAAAELKWRRALSFTVGFAVSFAIFHGLLAALLDRYAEGVFLFQMQRARVGVSGKISGFLNFLAEPHVGFSFLATGCLLASPIRSARATAWFAVGALAVTTFTGNVLYLIYFAPILPLMMTSAALVVASATRAADGSCWPYFFAVLFTASGTAFSIKSELQEQRRLAPVHQDYIERLRSTPGGILLTDDGRVAERAGKCTVQDYYATDPNAMYELSPDRFRGWLAAVLPGADIVAISDKFLGWLDASDAKFLRDSGKPIVFESDSVERRFFALAAQ